MSATVATQVRATAYTQPDKRHTKQGTVLSEEVQHTSNITKTYTECSAVQVYWIFSYTRMPKEGFSALQVYTRGTGFSILQPLELKIQFLSHIHISIPVLILL